MTAANFASLPGTARFILNPAVEANWQAEIRLEAFSAKTTAG
jgi:hypothetical protein